MKCKFTPQKPGVKIVMWRFLHLMVSGNKLTEQVHSTYLFPYFFDAMTKPRDSFHVMLINNV